jgi:hypothetical protein
MVQLKKVTIPFKWAAYQQQVQSGGLHQVTAEWVRYGYRFMSGRYCKSWPLLRMRFFVVFLCPCSQMPRQYLKIKPWQLLSEIFPIHYSLIILSLYHRVWDTNSAQCKIILCYDSWKPEQWTHKCQSQSHIMIDIQSANQSWCQAPIWDPRPILLYPLNFLQAVVFL